MKIGIVSDSAATVQTLRERLHTGSHDHVIWVAVTADEAVEVSARSIPDLILLDLRLGTSDGAHVTRRIMTESRCPILVVTDSVGANAERVFEAMGAGALDAVDLAAPGDGTHSLLAKMDLVARLMGDTDRHHRVDQGRRNGVESRSKRLIAIGASAGGPAALATLLGHLPRDFAAAIVIVQHVDEQFACGLADWLGQYSTLPVRIARHGETTQPGTVLVAGTGDHLILTGPDRLGYTPEPREYVYRPSVDVFFESVDRYWHGEAVGVLLTGMGRDGARGLRALRDRGHHTIAQDEASSALYGMPKAAAAMQAAAEILSIDRIAPRLVELVNAGATVRKSPARSSAFQ